MSELSAERFAQRAYDAGLLETTQVEGLWGELGTRDVPLDAFVQLVVRKELLTNFQVERLVKGERRGYFYGKYKVLYIVGTGTFARVYRSVHLETGRVVAVKVLRQRYSDDTDTTDQFIREAQMVQKLRHPNIVPIYEIDSERNRAFMVMEFVEGRNLREFVRVRKQLEVVESLNLMADICAGLDYALSKGVTHRDLKLSNVLVSSKGRAKLVDFGLAGMHGETADKERAVAPRSIDYAGLERITGVRNNDPRSDIYFAGCMLYHMIAGRSPLFETRDRSKRLSTQRFREVKPMGEFISGVPAHVVALVMKAMELRPEKRFGTPAEMLVELKRSIKRIEAGDVDDTIPDEAESEAATEKAAPAPPAIAQEGEHKSVMIVESNVELQNILREQLKRRGYRVLVTADPARAAARFQDDEAVADCVVFCADELGELAVETFNEFGENETTRDIPAIVIVDKSQKDLIRAAKVGDHRLLLSMPIRMKILRAALLKLLRRRDQAVSG